VERVAALSVLPTAIADLQPPSSHKELWRFSGCFAHYFIFISFVLFGKQTHTKKQQKTTDKINKQTHE